MDIISRLMSGKTARAAILEATEEETINQLKSAGVPMGEKPESEKQAATVANLVKTLKASGKDPAAMSPEEKVQAIKDNVPEDQLKSINGNPEEMAKMFLSVSTAENA